jgi:uncharacterized protein
MKRIGSFLVHLPVSSAILVIRFYQRFLSPLLGSQCRFHPSCSRYGIEALRKYGFLRGSWKTIYRIARCNPLHPGGHDPP